MVLSTQKRPLLFKGLAKKTAVTFNREASLFGVVCASFCSFLEHTARVSLSYLSDIIAFFVYASFGKLFACLEGYFLAVAKPSMVRVGHTLFSSVTGPEFESLQSRDLLCVGEVTSKA